MHNDNDGRFGLDSVIVLGKKNNTKTRKTALGTDQNGPRGKCPYTAQHRVTYHMKTAYAHN